MQVVFHVGMGKTGTTSIQRALEKNQQSLREQNVEYLGGWFHMLEPPLTEPGQLRRFADEPAEKIKEYGKLFASHIKSHAANHGTKLFILSNEGLAGYSRVFSPFATEIGKVAEVRILAYARNVWTWLPSAYAQWGMRHKNHSKKIRSFREQSIELARTYMQPVNWSRYLGDLYELRSYDATSDVVQDFAETVGITLPQENARFLERSDSSELLMRALFNNLHDEPVGASKFNRSVLNAAGKVETLDQNIGRYFNYGAMDDAVSEHKEIFEKIKEKFGLDLMANPSKRPKRPSPEKMRERLFDLLLHITLDQSKRIEDLQAEIQALRNEISKSR